MNNHVTIHIHDNLSLVRSIRVSLDIGTNELARAVEAPLNTISQIDLGKRRTGRWVENLLIAQMIRMRPDRAREEMHSIRACIADNRHIPIEDVVIL